MHVYVIVNDLIYMLCSISRLEAGETCEDDRDCPEGGSHLHRNHALPQVPAHPQQAQVSYICDMYGFFLGGVGQ